MIIAFDREQIPAELEQLAPADVLSRWREPDRSQQNPRLVVTTDADGGWTGVALVSARPHTAYLKIVDVLGDAASPVLEYAETLGAVKVVWEGWTLAQAPAGFEPMLPPLPSGPGSTEPAQGYVRWLAEPQVRETRYYRQTTDFTCGAVSALTAAVQAGEIAPDGLDRDLEMTFWRDATNFPAIEPVGLGVAVQRDRPNSVVRVDLDTDEPVLLEHLSGSEQEWRAFLQQQSRTEAAALGLPVTTHRLGLPELTGIIRDGGAVLLLIDLTLMRGFGVPHWILGHGLAGESVLTEDPHVSPAVGETWLDGHLLPIPVTELEAMAAVESRGRRGAVILR